MSSTNGVNGSQGNSDILFGAKPKKVENPADALTSKDTFLKLLVAQMKYQDPLKPADGMQYVTQLAQFTDLEQTMSMNKEIGTIRGILEKFQATAHEKTEGTKEQS
jgi:flagellar basal-body rod modification protein FlgD